MECSMLSSRHLCEVIQTEVMWLSATLYEVDWVAFEVRFDWKDIYWDHSQ